MTDGKFAPCHVVIVLPKYHVRHFSTSHTLGLATIDIGGECTGCPIQGFCWGRCLYSNLTPPWGEAERQLVCSTLKTLYTALPTQLPRVRGLIRNGAIAPADFLHEKFNGCEIIP